MLERKVTSLATSQAGLGVGVHAGMCKVGESTWATEDRAADRAIGLPPMARSLCSSARSPLQQPCHSCTNALATCSHRHRHGCQRDRSVCSVEYSISQRTPDAWTAVHQYDGRLNALHSAKATGKIAYTAVQPRQCLCHHRSQLGHGWVCPRKCTAAPEVCGQEHPNGQTLN